jgi:hypothetical protein
MLEGVFCTDEPRHHRALMSGLPAAMQPKAEVNSGVAYVFVMRRSRLALIAGEER